MDAPRRRLKSLWFMVYGSGGLEFLVQGSGFRAQGLGFKEEFWVRSLESEVSFQGLGVRV